MNFQDAVKTCLTKYVDFSGRATRPEYWFFVLFVAVVSVVLSIVSQTLAGVFWLAMLVPSIAAGIRRLHDTERSGWWLLIGFIPVIGGIILIILMAQPTKNSAIAVPGTVL